MIKKYTSSKEIITFFNLLFFIYKRFFSYKMRAMQNQRFARISSTLDPTSAKSSTM